MAKYLHSAVLLYADNNAHILTDETVKRGILWDGGECPPITDDAVCVATAEAVRGAINPLLPKALSVLPSLSLACKASSFGPKQHGYMFVLLNDASH